MAEGNGSNGPTGPNGAGSPAENGAHKKPVAVLVGGAKAVGVQAAEEIKALKQIDKTDVYKSVLRVKHDETPRSRALGVLSNVFLHLHPAKINRDAVAYKYTWGMDGRTVYLYITLVFTATLLMFYYHPSM